MSRVSAARMAAYDVLSDVDEKDSYANLAMPHAIAAHHLDGRDAGFATELAYSTLRMRGLYDAVIASASGRRIETLEPEVRRVLQLGTHQVLGMRVEAHAAVSQAVEMAVEIGKRRASGLVNAVMRRVSEADRDAWLARVAAGNGRAALAVRHSHPEWIVAALEAALAADGRAGQVGELLASHNESAPVTLAVRPGLVTLDELADVSEPARGVARTAAHLRRGIDPGSVSAVKSGLAGVQDEGSQAAALALVDAPLDGPDDRWLDMCAGPGGKAVMLGAIAAERGATLDALELHEHRAELMRANLAALPEGVVTVHATDALEWHGEGYDRVLLDAPCTGLGALRRRPEARWRRSQADLDALVMLQRQLLRKALAAVRPGGVVAYVTCSPHLAETREQVAAAVALPEGGVELIDARDVIGAAELGTHRDVQLWTHAHGTDSMYIALLRRTLGTK